ncbi:MAG: serine/threonine protein kinase [Planctomycetaceae bacterium]|nr:serine/threonine protein kinase [Planctomycetaceae bacterium]
MPNFKTTCNPDAISLLLDDRLADDERTAVETHLDGCPDCRERLERQAAEPGLWAEARDFLSSVDDVSSAEGQVRPGEMSADSSAGGHGAWRDDADLARVDHIQSYLGPTDDPRMLGRFGGYEIAGIIGCGGMGVVLKGLDVALNRFVAIKALAPHLATSAAARLRFAREARAAAAVVHENVIAIHAVSEANGLPYLVMPYVRGTSLQKRLDAQGRLTTIEILRIGMQAAAGLAAAHAQGLVHRDIKPGNILLEDGVERLTITDFGLARAADDASLTRSGVIAGTPQFMSPEQARGDSIDRRSDLFSLGSVLYSLCTGHPPFRAETSYGVLRRITDDRQRPIREVNPEIPEWLSAIIDTLLAKKPGDRYSSAEEVATLFEECLAHVQQPTVVPLPEALRSSRNRFAASPRKLLMRLGIAVAALAVLIVAVASVRHDWPRRDHSSGPEELSGPAASNKSGDLPAAVPSAAARWNDGVAEGIVELEHEIGAAEESAQRDWLELPIAEGTEKLEPESQQPQQELEEFE